MSADDTDPTAPEQVEDPTRAVDATPPAEPDDPADVTGPDETEADDTEADDTARTVRRTGSAAAAAATRARRIGGRAPVTRTGSDQPAAAPENVTGPEADPEPTETVKRRVRFRKSANTADTSDAATSDDPATTAREPVTGFPTFLAESTAVPPSSGGSRRSDTLVRWIPAAVLIVALIVMAVVVAVSTHGSRWARPGANAERDQVLAAAKSCVVATNTYSYKDLDGFEKKGLACATGNFSTQFKNSVDKILRKGAPPVKQVQSLQVNTAGLISVSRSNEWQVLVYGQISVTNTSTTAARIDPFGAVATMRQVGGSWRLTSLCSQSLGGTTDSCY